MCGMVTILVDFEKVYEEYFSKIYNFMFYKVLNKEIAEDLTSEFFIKLLTNKLSLQWISKEFS